MSALILPVEPLRGNQRLWPGSHAHPKLPVPTTMKHHREGEPQFQSGPDTDWLLMVPAP